MPRSGAWQHDGHVQAVCALSRGAELDVCTGGQSGACPRLVELLRVRGQRRAPSRTRSPMGRTRRGLEHHRETRSAEGRLQSTDRRLQARVPDTRGGRSSCSAQPRRRAEREQGCCEDRPAHTRCARRRWLPHRGGQQTPDRGGHAGVEPTCHAHVHALAPAPQRVSSRDEQQVNVTAHQRIA